MAENTGDASQATGDVGSIEYAASLLDRMANPKGDSADASEGEDKAKAPEPESETEESEQEEPEQGESDEDEEPEAAPEKPQKYRVKVADEEHEVTLDELQKGYSREADYTRKTMALSAKEKAFEAEKQEAIAKVSRGIEQEREQYRSTIAILEQQFSAVLGTEEDLEQLRQTDPSAYAVKVADRTRIAQKIQHYQTERQRLDHEDQLKSFQAKQQKASSEAQKLLAIKPDWKEPAKMQDGMSAINSYVESIGGDRSLVGQIEDHWMLVALADAAAFKALQSKKPEPVPKPVVVKTVQPGVTVKSAKPKTEIDKANARLAKSGHINDVAAVLRARGIA